MSDDQEKPIGQDKDEDNPEKMGEEELRAELEKHFREQSVSDLVVQFMVTLSNLAYMKMGITDETKAAKDLEQASLAIDAFKTLLSETGKRLPGQDASALAGALSSMQLTFVKVSAAEAGGEPPGAGSAGSEETDVDAGDDSTGDPDTSDAGERASDKPEDDDPASRLWVPGKE